MVKLGFICEGDSEKIIIESEAFRKLLNSLKMELAGDVINSRGNGNLLPKHMDSFTDRLAKFEPDHIVILTDLDEDKCITLTKERIDPNKKFVTIVSVRALESWFIGDREAYNDFMEGRQESVDPELIAKPYEYIKEQRMLQKGVGVSKLLLARAMLKRGFSVERSEAASAKYFVQKLRLLAKGS